MGAENGGDYTLGGGGIGYRMRLKVTATERPKPLVDERVTLALQRWQ